MVLWFNNKTTTLEMLRHELRYRREMAAAYMGSTRGEIEAAHVRRLEEQLSREERKHGRE